MGNEASNFFKSEILRLERNMFLGKFLSSAILYTVITLWLNSIRVTASIYFVWILIVIQFAFYFSIFIVSYRYSKVCGLNKNISLILFTLITVLGRVNDWELLIIPLLVVIMLVCAVKNKNLSEKGIAMLPDNSKS